MELKSILNYYKQSDYPKNTIKERLSNYPEIFSESSKIPLLKNDPEIKFEISNFVSEPKGKYRNNYKRIFNPKQITSPFASCEIIEDFNERIWIYIDEFDTIQGPFTTVEMDNWYNQQFFPMDLLIGLADRERCIRLGDFIISTYPFSKNPNLHIKRTVNEF
jgi:hypothetical protein